MDRRPDPPHDRVRLTADERAALSSFERSMAEHEVARSGRGRAQATIGAGGRWLGRLAARFVRLAPWIAVIGLVALLPAASTSDVAGQLCALVVTAALTIWIVTKVRVRVRHLLSRMSAATDQEEGHRHEGRP
jgi:hypothetical protein